MRGTQNEKERQIKREREMESSGLEMKVLWGHTAIQDWCAADEGRDVALLRPGSPPAALWPSSTAALS